LATFTNTRLEVDWLGTCRWKSF